ncbi:alpha/beta hydrolase-fold protein [Kineococcus indalonis]|uniref:alpha/beta hydrolase-fold protein n=1 Tax=Kineococcus indalonis TaxID=2696566 RepID=UPI001412B0AF|nr:alpha/beta hydrolase-fold protein [Kineococcus indalonis]NAZ85952.1 enterochelin esterase-like enzyme [Kineococcus indalonis]
MTGPSRRSFVAALAGTGIGAAAVGAVVTDRVEAGRGDGSAATTSVTVTLAGAAADGPVTGRLYVVLSRDDSSEPRDQAGDPLDGAPFWGVDVQGWEPGTSRTVPLGAGADGHPFADAADLPAGAYSAQAFVNVYTRFTRSDGSVVDLHLPGGDGHDVFRSAGNLFGPVARFTPGGGEALELSVDTVVAPGDEVPEGGTAQQGNPPDSEHVRHVKIRSEVLSGFWGQDVFIGADVLLPPGYDDPVNQAVRYPVEVHHGHFPTTAPRGFREDGEGDFSAYWLSGTAPRFLVVTFRHENPFYDDSYAVDSANIGPYGTALNTELLPEIDRTFRTVGQRWGRVLSGGSTGGWEVVATQVTYPDLYRGAWAGYPDPLDFRALGLVDVYSDEDAYATSTEYQRTPVPFTRESSGRTTQTVEQANSWERALGSRGRSGLGQWDVWQAVFSPQGPDGYPAAVWDKASGRIDRAVAAQWAERWDLAAHVERHWDELREKLDGQLTIYVGDADTYFLDVAVQLFKERVDALEGSNVTYLFGRGQSHGWEPWTYREFYDMLADHVVAGAPAGEAEAARAWRAMAAPADGTGDAPRQ